MQLFVLNIIIANVVKKCCEFKFHIAYEQALRGALAAGREQEGELATTSLEFEFRLQFPRRLSCQISANQCKVEVSADVNKH